MRLLIFAADCSVLRFVETDYRVDEEADKGKTFKVSIAGVSMLACLHEDIQYETTESNAHGTPASSYGDNIHNQDATPKACLENVHCEECSWLQSVTEEEYDCENVDEKDDDDKQHKDNDRPEDC